MEHSYRFYQNRECEYFPCHKVSNEEEFNCLFCFCPLYALGSGCGGNCTYTKEGIKDCSACLLPHSPKGYDYITDKFKEVAAIAKANRKENEE
ncbi:MAG: cysteine-rich small domain-containing protein [Oscillospiraceae bacterium]|nr:cysteine-rich small domain-containing protein [Oscillospiraceae bacterium]